MSYCSVHPTKLKARGKECVKCVKVRRMEDATAMKEKLLTEEAERQALVRNSDSMSQKGKDRKPRASISDKSAAE